ncbi:helix-turn-helix domain-containing protein [Streptomyces sp. NPDC059985]|uniref:helix-turn-helix domain-containing protein n=1 Tax=Streptomyces sp. NPDC059985 TaxID=3347025 RepID=UPI0036A60F1E
MMCPDGIAVLLRARREAAGRTREAQGKQIGDALGAVFDLENIKRWETGRRIPTPVWYPAISAAYGISLDAIRTAVAASRRWRREYGQESADVERRRFMGVATAAGLAVLPGIAQARENIEAGLGGAGSEADLAYLQAAFERHRGGYNGRSPDTVLAEMHTDLDLLAQVMRRPHPAADRTELARTAAGIAGLVAIVQHDRGDQADAFRWFATAERAGRESGDRRMTAWVLARQAMVPLNYGAPEAAARIAAQARREAGENPTGAGALAAAVAARALAASGNTAAAHAAINDVKSLAERLDGAESADTWFGYPEQKHHVHLSQAYTLLGDTQAAYREQDTTLELTGSPSVMTRALIAVDTATCLRVDGDHAEAATMAVGVWERLPAPYRQGLIRSRTQALQRQLTGRARDLLGEALQTA